MKGKIIVCMLSLAILSGCAGQLQVFDANQSEIKGVPFRTAELYVKKGFYTKHSKGGDCAKTPFVDTAALPTGARYFATAKSAQFAKTSFHMKFADSGVLSEIGLDSEPAAAETLKATSDLIKTVFPSLGAAAAVGGGAAPAPAGGAAPPPLKACDVGEEEVNFTKFEDYLKMNNK